MERTCKPALSKLAQGAVLLFLAGWAWSALAQTQGRTEQTEPSVAYSGKWTQSASQPWSGGSAALSAAEGAQVAFTFTGTSVSWIGGRAPDTGIARIFLDGVFVAEVDTYFKTDEVRVPMFALHDLPDAQHVLTVEVTGRKNVASTSALVIVDAFDVPAATISRLQETDPAAVFSPDWVQDNPVVSLIPGFTTGRTQGSSLRKWSAGAAKVSATPGAKATFTFTGTGIRWIGGRGPQTGIARVYLDRVFVARIDLYSPGEAPQKTVFTAADLPPGTHTLTVEVTGEKNALSTDTWVLVDAFDVLP